MTKRALIAGVVVVACLVPLLAAAQNSDGSRYYRQYCASCHGLQGRGDGPHATSTKIPNLTTLQEPGEPFPGIAVLNTIDGTHASRAHAQSGMPIWGRVFDYTKGTPPRDAVIWSIVQHLKTVQVNKVQ